MRRVARCVIVVALVMTAGRLSQGAENDVSIEQRIASEFDHDDPKATEIRMRALAREAEVSGDVAAVTEILTQLARAQGLQGHLKEAAETLDRAAALRTDAVRPRVRLLIERGRLARRQGRPEDARLQFERAYEAALAGGEIGLAADSAHILALLLPFEDARAWTDRGLVLAERASDPAIQRWVGVLANNWGWRLDEQGDHAGAALAFARALNARRIENDLALIRASEFALGVELRKLGQRAQALAIQERLQEEATSAKEPIGEILVERVENLIALHRKEEARSVAKGALRLLTDRDDPGPVERLRAILKEMPG